MKKFILAVVIFFTIPSFARDWPKDQAVLDSLTQYISKHAKFDKEKKQLTFDNIDIQEFSTKDPSHEYAFFMFLGKQFFDPIFFDIRKKEN